MLTSSWGNMSVSSGLKLAGLALALIFMLVFTTIWAPAAQAASPVEEWATHHNGSGNDLDIANAIVVDGSGNVYVTGQSTGTSSSDYDYTTIKYNRSGNQQWEACYNGPSNEDDTANALAVDGANLRQMVRHVFSLTTSSVTIVSSKSTSKNMGEHGAHVLEKSINQEISSPSQPL